MPNLYSEIALQREAEIRHALAVAHHQRERRASRRRSREPGSRRVRRAAGQRLVQLGERLAGVPPGHARG